MNPTIKARIESIRWGEVPEGYKRTKIGIVPNEWVTNVTLKSICTINPKTEQLPDQFIYIDLESVVDGVLVSKKIIKKSNAPSRAQRVLQVNDVIYQMVRPYQRNNYLFCHESKCYKYVASTGYAQLRAKCYAFLYYLINSDYFCAQVLEKCTGSNYPAINSEDLASISITYPKKEAEQQKIAEILAGQDRVIALKEKLLAEKQKQKKYLMQQLLTGKKRLPGFSGKWETNFLRNVCDNLDNFRKPFNRDERAIMKGIYPYYGANGIVDYIDRYIFDETIILLAEDGGDFENYFKKPIAQKVTGKCWVNNHAHVLRAKKNYCSEFIFYLLEHKDIRKYINGTTRSKLTKEDMQGILLYYPTDKKEQIAIADILSTADKEIELLKKDIEQEKLKKKSLMQLLLTGIVRVNELVS